MISGRVTNLQGIERMAQKVKSAEQATQGRAVQFSLMLRERIRLNIAAILGEKSKHITIDMDAGGFVTVITVKPNSQVGKYIWAGSRPHVKRSSRPMPIGDGRFAYKVHHPGTKGKEEQIHAAITKAFIETKAAMMAGGRKLL
jgi:hypothetical protein